MVRFSENIAKISTHNTAQPDVNYPPPLVDMIEKGYSWIVISFVKKKKRGTESKSDISFYVTQQCLLRRSKSAKKMAILLI